jgi:hypothetical protein
MSWGAYIALKVVTINTQRQKAEEYITRVLKLLSQGQLQNLKLRLRQSKGTKK